MVEQVDEQQRIENLLAPLKQDKQEWDATYTEEERQKGAEFE